MKPPCLLAGYPACFGDCLQGRRPCLSPSEYEALRQRNVINRAALDRQIEAKSETRNLFQLLLAKGSIVVSHRHKPSIWRRLWLALT